MLRIASEHFAFARTLKTFFRRIFWLHGLPLLYEESPAAAPYRVHSDDVLRPITMLGRTTHIASSTRQHLAAATSYRPRNLWKTLWENRRKRPSHKGYITLPGF